MIGSTNADLSLRSAYEFDLPEDLIAEKPAEPRDAAKLMIVHGEERENTVFSHIGDYLRQGDLLVVNDVRVSEARLCAKRDTGGNVEFLLLDDPTYGRRFRAIHKSRRKLKDGEILTLVPGGEDRIRVRTGDPECSEVEFLGDESVPDILHRIGQMPLPPYIVKRRKNLGLNAYEKSDGEDYQTVYADKGAAVAAPTAGLHFTDSLIARLEENGVRFARLRLDVGIGTFRPVKSENLSDHRMHSEHYVIASSLKQAFERCRAEGGRVIAVGTTVVRSLEDQFSRFGQLVEGEYDTDIFIRPGHVFRAVDAVVTNFHLPGSTLIVLVSAFAGHAAVMRAYESAIADRYRFYSYGDAMMLLPAKDAKE